RHRRGGARVDGRADGGARAQHPAAGRMGALDGQRARGRRDRRGGHARQALCLAGGRRARERDPGPGGPRAGGGEVDEPRLEKLAADLEADEATALLEQLTALVHEAVDVLEQAGESLESDEGTASPE